MELEFFTEDIEFDFTDSDFVKASIQKIQELEIKEFETINYIFCSDEYLREINQEYLNREYYTDIITFTNQEDPVQGDIFVSIDRIGENAILFDTGFQQELRRVLIHGLLHLCGYEDYDAAQKKRMTEKEDFYLNFS